MAWSRLILALGMVIGVTTPAFAQAGPPAAERPADALVVNDRWEVGNRRIFKFNQDFDRFVLKPTAQTYRFLVPAPGRRGITNLIDTLDQPWSGANHLAQGKVRGFFHTLDRFLINAVFGFGGLVDRASEWGIPRQNEDLGQTLAVWGVPSGPYLMVPGLGPSNPRDFFGFVSQVLFDPTDIVIEQELGQMVDFGLLGMTVIDIRSRAIDTADRFIETSEDPYVAIRSAYEQRRRFQILDGEVRAEAADDPFEPAEPAPPAP